MNNCEGGYILCLYEASVKMEPVYIYSTILRGAACLGHLNEDVYWNSGFEASSRQEADLG
jgi:hypothetical protein